MENAFAQRLVNARKIRCMSQRELSNKLEGQVSPTAIEKYEKGLMMPSSSALILLSKALGMKLDYFFRPFTVAIDTKKFEFRKSASMGVKKVESIKYMVCAEIEKYLEIEGILGNMTTFTLDYSNILVEGEDEAKLLARRLREDLNIGSDAIVSAVELLESCGVKIIEIDHDDKFSGTCNTAGTIPVIVINRNMTSERKRITIFHELGHLLMHCAEGVDEEKMCNIFANEVLIPSDKFKSLLGASRHDISLVELQAIQREYGISVDALMAKAAQLNIITNNRYTSYYKKKNALPAFKEAVEASHYPMEHTNRFERLVYRALASEVISTSKAAALLDISVNEVRNNLNLM
ncbi:MAG: XRE family transcriptional regulator [Prevotella sp.]|nr:XRE family transcriptional regulator [Prevotella sp.]